MNKDKTGERFAVAMLAFVLLAGLQGPCAAQWEMQQSGTKARLRGVSAVNDEVAWATGAPGTVLRTSDGGSSWRLLAVSGGETLDFRDVHAFGDKSACILAIGPGELSRIYRTADGGVSWSLAFRGDDPKVFLDAIAFWDVEHGIAIGDPIDGRFLILTTDDGGRTWGRPAGVDMPLALAGE